MEKLNVIASMEDTSPPFLVRDSPAKASRLHRRALLFNIHSISRTPGGSRETRFR